MGCINLGRQGNRKFGGLHFLWVSLGHSRPRISPCGVPSSSSFPCFSSCCFSVTSGADQTADVTSYRGRRHLVTGSAVQTGDRVSFPPSSEQTPQESLNLAVKHPCEKTPSSLSGFSPCDHFLHAASPSRRVRKKHNNTQNKSVFTTPDLRR